MDAATYNKQIHHPLQTWQWGEARKEMGLEVVRIDTYTMTVHAIPYTPYQIGYIPRSPAPSADLIDTLIDYGRKNNVIFIKFEPNVEADSGVSIDDKRLVPSAHPLFPRWTQILDLTPSEDELMKQLKPKTRYNIRLAKKRGVEVKEVSTDAGFEIFSQLYFDTCKRQGYHGHTPQYHRIIWKHLKDDIAHILIAYFENEPMAAYELFYFDHTLYYPYGGSSDKHRKLMASNLLMWEAILRGKKWGAKEFDMWGSLPPDYDRSASWSGFTRFKQGYGTEFKQFVGSYDLVIQPMLYQLYNGAYTIRERLLGH